MGDFVGQILLSPGKNSVQHRWGAQGMKSSWRWKYLKNIILLKCALWIQAKKIHRHLAETEKEIPKVSRGDRMVNEINYMLAAITIL